MVKVLGKELEELVGGLCLIVIFVDEEELARLLILFLDVSQFLLEFVGGLVGLFEELSYLLAVYILARVVRVLQYNIEVVLGFVESTFEFLDFHFLVLKVVLGYDIDVFKVILKVDKVFVFLLQLLTNEVENGLVV